MEGTGEFPPPPLDLAHWALDRWGDPETATREARLQALILALRGDEAESERWLQVAAILSRLN